MKSTLKIAGTAALLALAACGGNADDIAADNIEAMTENRADALEDAADVAPNAQASATMEAQAEGVREMGDDAAEAADDNDDARIENQVANAM